MKNQINSILMIFSILALIAIAVSGIFLVLDLGSGPEIKEALEKIIYILGILLVLSFVITSITKIKNTKDKGFGLIGILVVVGILIAGGYYYYSRSNLVASNDLCKIAAEKLHKSDESIMSESKMFQDQFKDKYVLEITKEESCALILAVADYDASYQKSMSGGSVDNRIKDGMTLFDIRTIFLSDYLGTERAKEINDAEVNFLKKQGQTSLDL
ncbi:hypothetical protein A3E89_01355 [Candidatus Campbellbacteria bacterium RIFCSPHIGHO2_12_FULL_35_10]|uniref:Uncharacterized protein n=1 Tax=Candidatus Campbellbacteria bacterium RIFCSPHIGHO2_12_FULL_35_10 TaxID=1797578 RepID=A0A1F5EQK9_9BACT|nr:MAG: hypothetical protein A3E89_01355 [Candidatus Campbellbacteria bacterium RIFCSPHIGHO2_12_FULL_35_10]